MKLDILTPEKTLFSGDADSVTLPGTLGAFTILPNHAPMISSLRPDHTLSYTQEGKTESIVIGGGFVEVRNNHIIVCAEAKTEAPELKEQLSNP